jgi:hypothetical protein
MTEQGLQQTEIHVRHTEDIPVTNKFFQLALSKAVSASYTLTLRQI